MKKSDKLKCTNFALATIIPLALVSSIQMEACGGELFYGIKYTQYMPFHAIVGALMFALVVVHLYLHFDTKNWATKIKRLKNRPTKILIGLFGLMALSSAFALAHNVSSMHHSVVGAVHGKIGFVFIALCLAHIIKRRRFYCALMEEWGKHRMRDTRILDKLVNDLSKGKLCISDDM